MNAAGLVTVPGRGYAPDWSVELLAITTHCCGFVSQNDSVGCGLGTTITGASRSRVAPGIPKPVQKSEMAPEKPLVADDAVTEKAGLAWAPGSKVSPCTAVPILYPPPNAYTS